MLYSVKWICHDFLAFLTSRPVPSQLRNAQVQHAVLGALQSDPQFSYLADAAGAVRWPPQQPQDCRRPPCVSPRSVSTAHVYAFCAGGYRSTIDCKTCSASLFCEVLLPPRPLTSMSFIRPWPLHAMPLVRVASHVVTCLRRCAPWMGRPVDRLIR